MGRKLLSLSVALAAFMAAGSASAAVSVLGSSNVNQCSAAALAGDAGDADLQACNAALLEALTDHAKAGTLVNRGVLLLRLKQYDNARADFKAAEALEPTLGEAVVNNGASYLAQKRYMDALAEIDRGLALNPEEPEKAYYNRALANEGLDDMKAAYLDYMKALELAPNWDAPRHELARFTVQDPNTGKKNSALDNAPPAPPTATKAPWKDPAKPKQ
jgi:tetratricopeptide (TPR) repeat protein